MPMTDEEFDKSLYGPTGKPAPQKEKDTASTDFIPQFSEALVQGGPLGIIESGGLLAEKGIQAAGYPNFRMPLHDWAKRKQQRVESTTTGRVGEFIGAWGTGVGELRALASVARAIPSLQALLRSPSGRAAVYAMMGLTSRPTSSPEEAVTQAVSGGAMGPLAGGVSPAAAQAAGHLAGHASGLGWLGSSSLGHLAARAAGTLRPPPTAAAELTGPKGKDIVEGITQ